MIVQRNQDGTVSIMDTNCVVGWRRYHGFTQSEAIARYKAEANKMSGDWFVCEKVRKDLHQMRENAARPYRREVVAK